MSISEGELKRNLLWSVIGTAFLALFGAVYENYSHEVYSYYMIYAFALPLLLGVLLYTLLIIRRIYPVRTAVRLWNSGIAAMSVGSAFKGVLDIYGTTNPLIAVYPVAGYILLSAGLVIGLAELQQAAERK